MLSRPNVRHAVTTINTSASITAVASLQAGINGTIGQRWYVGTARPRAGECRHATSEWLSRLSALGRLLMNNISDIEIIAFIDMPSAYRLYTSRL